tara:strand:+ start:71 stop:1474 length:1404 start_codon:yes stop_codon:yes gene_type:complete
MAITIPASAEKTFEKVMDALGGEDYSYYLFDVKNVNESDRAKKVVEMVVYVPQTQRVTAAAKIQDALSKDNVTAEVLPKETELNVYLTGDVKKYIRLNVKPNGSKGSGGGAAATAIQEAAQCVYAAMRYECGEKEIYTEDDLRCGMNHVDVGGTKLEDIMGLPKEWKEGSMKGANEIFKKVGGSGYKFVRGDRLLDDGSIKNAFKRVKGQTNLSSEDKWNPADIWMVKESEMAEIKKHLDGESTIDCLNNALLQRFNDGSLIGISLKKIEGDAKMDIKNNQPASVRKANEKAKFVKYDLTFTSSMDVYLYYGSGTFEKFQARNFGGSTKGDWKLELKGRSAAQGKIQGTVLIELLKNAGFTNISQFKIPTWAESDPKANKAGDITTEIYNLLKDYSATKFDKSPKAEANNKAQIAIQDKSWRYSKLAGLRFLDWLQKTCSDKDMAMKEMYLYASSQSDKSSVYYKLQ